MDVYHLYHKKTCTYLKRLSFLSSRGGLLNLCVRVLWLISIIRRRTKPSVDCEQITFVSKPRAVTLWHTATRHLINPGITEVYSQSFGAPAKEHEEPKVGKQGKLPSPNFSMRRDLYGNRVVKEKAADIARYFGPQSTMIKKTPFLVLKSSTSIHHNRNYKPSTLTLWASGNQKKRNPFQSFFPFAAPKSFEVPLLSVLTDIFSQRW